MRQKMSRFSINIPCSMPYAVDIREKDKRIKDVMFYLGGFYINNQDLFVGLNEEDKADVIECLCLSFFNEYQYKSFASEQAFQDTLYSYAKMYMHKINEIIQNSMSEDDEEIEEYMVEEFCHHCGKTARLLWNAEQYGYHAFCPFCGEELMLCNECVDDQTDVEECDNHCDLDNSGMCYRKMESLLEKEDEEVEDDEYEPDEYDVDDEENIDTRIDFVVDQILKIPVPGEVRFWLKDSFLLHIEKTKKDVTMLLSEPFAKKFNLPLQNSNDSDKEIHVLVASQTISNKDNKAIAKELRNTLLGFVYSFGC